MPLMPTYWQGAVFVVLFTAQRGRSCCKLVVRWVVAKLAQLSLRRGLIYLLPTSSTLSARVGGTVAKERLSY